MTRFNVSLQHLHPRMSRQSKKHILHLRFMFHFFSRRPDCTSGIGFNWFIICGQMALLRTIVLTMTTDVCCYENFFQLRNTCEPYSTKSVSTATWHGQYPVTHERLHQQQILRAGQPKNIKAQDVFTVIV